MEPINLILLSGVSGAGKTTVSRVFEEMGYRVIENIPNGALPAVLTEIKTNRVAYEKTLIIIEMRHARHAFEIASNTDGIKPYFILLDCQAGELLSRYRLTRHIHPLQAKGLSLEKCIQQDAVDMKETRPCADLYIDSTGLKADDLRKIISLHVEGKETKAIVLSISSFGYKYGVPADADVVLDCRNVPNPFWLPELRPFTGLDRPIIEYLEAQPEVEVAYQKMEAYIDYFVESAEKNGRTYLNIDFGCSGGQHRSVYFAQRLFEHFRSVRPCIVNHRELHRCVK